MSDLGYGPRGVAALDVLCQQEGASWGYRLRGEFVPAEPPFPGSAEEAAWLERRESLLVTLLGNSHRATVLRSWRVGERSESEREELDPGELAAWTRTLEDLGCWGLRELGRVALGGGAAHFEHEAYAYQDEELDSLDLNAWSAPRWWRIGQGRRADGAPETRRFVHAYARFLPAALKGRSRLAETIDGAA